MSKTILIVLLIFGFNVNAQKFGFESFTNDKKGTSMAVKGASVVIEKEGTAKEIYDNVLGWIKEMYKNPEEVIVAKTDGEFIKINGAGIPLKESYAWAGGSVNKYILSFKFKDGRYKITINEVSFLYSNQYESKWLFIDSINYRKSNGKPHRDANWFDTIENYFNAIVLELNDYKNNDTNHDDDW